MPRVRDITTRAISGNGISDVGGRFRLDLPQRHAPVPFGRKREAVAFVRELEQLCDDYWASQDKGRETNYEDIAYVAKQIEDGLMSEYENPALYPLNQKLLDNGRTQDDLRDIADLTANYIEDVVCGMLGKPVGAVDDLAAISDAFNDQTVGAITVATLNHDLVLESLFERTRTRYSDGFGREHGTLRVWNNSFDVPSRRLLKLHGSIDWWRYEFTLDRFTGQFTAIPVNGDHDHPRGPNGENLGYSLSARPLILTGTFNKILAYPTGIYADQHFQFHNTLEAADALIVIGYGFRDKAINARIISWAERPGSRRMIVVHRDPMSFSTTARGAIRDKWETWQKRGLLAFMPGHLSPTTTWRSIKDLLA